MACTVTLYLQWVTRQISWANYEMETMSSKNISPSVNRWRYIYVPRCLSEMCQKLKRVFVHQNPRLFSSPGDVKIFLLTHPQTHARYHNHMSHYIASTGDMGQRWLLLYFGLLRLVLKLSIKLRCWLNFRTETAWKGASRPTFTSPVVQFACGVRALSCSLD